MTTARSAFPRPSSSRSLLAVGLVAAALLGCGQQEPWMAPLPAPDALGRAPHHLEYVVPAPVAGYEATGPDEVTREWSGPGFAYTLYTPKELGKAGRRHPILTWGNGTAAIPLFYEGLLRHFASHGIVVIASHSIMTGTGREMLQGVDWLIAENRRAGSRFFGKLDPAAIGATGHSQGGGGTINAGNDPRVRAIAPIQPAFGNIAGVKAPVFLTGGSADWLVPPDLLIRPFSYEPSKAPTVYGILTGATHFQPLGNADGYRGYLTAWFKHHLMSDAAAGALFYGAGCGLCTDGNWKLERKNL